MRGGGPRAGRQPLWTLTALGLTAGVAAGQTSGVEDAERRDHLEFRRAPAVQPISEIRKGEILIGMGADYASNYAFPLLAIEGDLARFGVVDIAYALAEGVLVELRGDLVRTIFVDRMGTPVIEPDDGLADDRSTGSGSYRLITLFRVVGDDEGPSAGLHFEYTIPSGNQSEGLGTNSINVRVSGLASYGRGPFRATADLGVGILEAPLESFEQNDVLVYSGELLYELPVRPRVRIFAEIDGRASTRSRVPIGTEDEGRLSFGADVGLGRWVLDVLGFVGYAGVSADWGLGAGLSFHIGG